MYPKKYISLIIIGGALLIASVALVVLLFSPDDLEESSVIAGNNNLNYSVYYVENNFIGEGKRPADVNYIMPYTDYIEVTNGITFKDEGASYLLNVIETFTINYQNGSDNSTVYQEKNEVVKQKRVNPGDPASIYTLDPWKHIETFNTFTQDRQSQVDARSVPGKNAAYYAEVSMEFEHRIQSVNGESSKETLTRQITIPLSGEVYKPVLAGESRFELTEGGGIASEPQSPLVIALVVLWLAVPCLIVIFCTKKLVDSRIGSNEADIILNKYSELIIMSIKPLDALGYKEIYVPEFKELVKLAAGLNKSILCYCFEKEAEFCVYADGLAYCYFAGKMSLRNTPNVIKTSSNEYVNIR